MFYQQDFSNVEADVFILDCSVSNDERITLIEQLRLKYEDIYLIIVVESFNDLMLYIKPSIRPSAILLKKEFVLQLNETVEQIVVDYKKRNAQKKSLTIKSGSDIFYVPEEDIIYIESLDKKIVVHTYGKEITYYSTLKKLEEELSENFLRCHHAYIVNIQAIKKVNQKELFIELEDDNGVPISRRFKESVLTCLEKMK
ncbi:MAG: LytTR family transcriptional regulator [Erysipelotrichaceae bacterium]|nr:LytTR family transcriptional regulator [Erysipelotrichaceae bacterium]